MTIRAGCSNCGAILKAEDRHAGRTVTCPRCQTPITLEPPQSDSLIDPFAEEAEASLAPRRKTPEKTEPAPPRRQRVPPPGESSDRPAPKRLPRKPEPEPEPEENFDEEPPEETYDTVSDGSFPDLTEEELAGQAISPRKKKKKRPAMDDDDRESPRTSTRLRRGLAELPSGGWRFHLHWVLLMALLPLGISAAMGDGPDLPQRVEESLQNHPEVNQESVDGAESAYDLAMLFPDHRLDGALLPADTYIHWGFALLSAGLFLTLFLFMWPGGEARPGALLASGATTGTIGIALLLGFQWIAFHMRGIRPGFRGRGIGILIFLIVQFIAFSYICALDDENGFAVSFFGFTFGVGLCEELCKAMPVAFYVAGSPKRDFRLVCLIGLASGVGFGVSEGITYSSDYYNGLSGGWIYLIRFASCVSLHAIWAGSVALLIYRDDQYLDWSWEGAFWFMMKYLFVSMLLHGLYDTLLKKEYEVIAFLTAIGSFLWFQWLLSQTAAEE